MNTKHTIYIITAVVLGFLITKQTDVRLRVNQVIDPKTVNITATEVAEAIKNNKKLRDELATLQDQKNNLSQSTSSKEASEASLTKETKQLQIVAGETTVTGSGVEIQFDKALPLTQLVDIINALRNIGAEAISINNNRIIASTPLVETFGQGQVTIKAIGDKNVLSDSLLRRGGIIEQLGGGKVVQSDNLELPAIKGK